jgi:hypothetical protein
LLLIAVSAAPAFAQSGSEPYIIKAWPAGLASLPCTAVARQADGGWKITAPIFVQGGERMQDVSFGSASGEARIIEQKCGPKRDTDARGQ